MKAEKSYYLINTNN